MLRRKTSDGFKLMLLLILMLLVACSRGEEVLDATNSQSNGIIGFIIFFLILLLFIPLIIIYIKCSICPSCKAYIGRSHGAWVLGPMKHCSNCGHNLESEKQEINDYNGNEIEK